MVPSSIKGRNSYKVELTPSGTNKLRSQWFFVEDRGYYWFFKKVMIQKKSKNVLTPLTREDRQNALENQAYTVTSNLTRNGSCRFIALCHILGRFGIYIYRSPESLWKEIVREKPAWKSRVASWTLRRDTIQSISSWNVSTWNIWRWINLTSYSRRF